MFPLMDDLLKPHVIQRDPKGMPDTRLRASVLLCKSFVHLEVRENQTQVDFKILWIQILDLLDRFMSVDKADQLVSISTCKIHAFFETPHSLKLSRMRSLSSEQLAFYCLLQLQARTQETSAKNPSGMLRTRELNVFCPSSSTKLYQPLRDDKYPNEAVITTLYLLHQKNDN